MNSFDIKAGQLERAFIRKSSANLSYATGTGKQNFIVTVSPDSIHIQTETGTASHSISRQKIRKAISYLYRKKTATRKELERYSHMNSSLMGLLQRMLVGIAKIVKTPKGLLRLTIKGVRFFFSGLDCATIEDLETVIKNGGRYILCSYYYLRRQTNQRLLEYIKEYGLQLLLDSGEFSAYKARESGKRVKSIKLKDYAAFINTFKPYIFGYFNLDATNQPQKSKQNFDRLKKLTDMSPIPIWHCNINDWFSSDWNALHQLVEEDHPVIGIGATVHMGLKAGPRLMTKVKDSLFGEIFRRHPNQNFHWLGGSSKIVFKYPLFSADSSGYIQGRKKHQVYYFDGEDISTRLEREKKPMDCLSENVRILSQLETMTNSSLLSI